MSKTKILCILDGFGLSVDSVNNCISQAKMPTLRYLLSSYPWTTLNADGDQVGQEIGLVGNSEVGHMNLGGLKLVPQLSYQITGSSKQAFALDKNLYPDQNFDPEVRLKTIFETKSKVIHLFTLFSTGCIHSDLRHLVGSIEAAGQAGATKIVLHLFSDGRDSDKKSLTQTWHNFTEMYCDRLAHYQDIIQLGSLGGRFFGMDRDKNWSRVLVAVTPWLAKAVSKSKATFVDFINDTNYCENALNKTNDLMARNTDKLKNILNYGDSTEMTQTLSQYKGVDFDQIEGFLSEYSKLNYTQENFDEAIVPACLQFILPSETIWLLNFRSDRVKQLTRILCDMNNYFKLDLTILTMNSYGLGIEDVDYYPVFTTKPVVNTLAETIAAAGKTQLHIAETEKYAHVTFFFNGGLEQKSTGEDWLVIPSNKVESHAQMPEMKAKEVTDYIISCLESDTDSNPFSKGSNEQGEFGGLNPRIEYNRDLKDIASEMRQNMTKAESLVWNNILKEDKTKFRFIPQKPLLNYIVDFYCFELNLVIEIDGDSHNYSLNYDELRTAELQKEGLRVIRFTNQEVYNNLDGVKNKIEEVILSTQSPKPYGLTPLKRGDLTSNSQSKSYDYIIVNYANPDMVGHTGDIPASIESMEFLDSQLARLVEACERDGHSMVIVADHGNMEFVGEYEESGHTYTDTEHNANPVPCILVNSELKMKNVELSDLFEKLDNQDLDYDRTKVGNSLSVDFRRDFDSDWLNESEIKQIKDHQLPLWYAGIWLLGL
jgi:2,3-bisphosphoglycerate-independent phosphoglycerate mutase